MHKIKISDNTKGYIYIRSHASYDLNNACKLGKSNNIPDRDTQYATGEITRGYFEDVYEVPITQVNIIERLLQFKFKNYNILYNAGTEFYDKQIITLIEPYLIELNIAYKKLTKQEIKELTKFTRCKTLFKKINIKSLIQYLTTHTRESIRTQIQQYEPVSMQTQNNNYIWNAREYQTSLINASQNILFNNSKIYIELPTGGGKSYIVYNLFKYLNSDFIIIISPRKIVNSQNISAKYLQILNDQYKVFNYSTQNNIDTFLTLKTKKILICCTQSVDKIREKLIYNNITNITIWFDEAHWGVEDWICNLNYIPTTTPTNSPTNSPANSPIITQNNNETNNTEMNSEQIEFTQENLDTNKAFWLLNNTYIKYRIFTSASPNKKLVLNNSHIFGILYSPIKVKELMKLKWLSQIKPYVYSENKENVNNIKYILGDFTEYNGKYGFSFHNKQHNAFNLFYKHYELFKNNETHIKPFLLVSDNFTIEREPRLLNITLDYDYKNIKIFETSCYSIGYVVAKYSMGYDFNKLNYMCITDPKLSIQDIKQCIGRGIRSDELGANGTNKDKVLTVSLPVYIDDTNNNNNNYKTIIEVLNYLIYDIEILFEDIQFKNRYIPTNHTDNSKISTSTAINLSNNYDGIYDMKSILLNLLELENNKALHSEQLKITYEAARKIVIKYKFQNKESYYKLCDVDSRLSKEPDIVFKGYFTSWSDYFGIERKYYDFETCRTQIYKILDSHPEIYINYLNLASICHELCKMDPLFPPEQLWTDYYNVRDLRDIINLLPAKRKKNISKLF